VTAADDETALKVFSARVFGSNLASDSNYQFSLVYGNKRGGGDLLPFAAFYMCAHGMACICCVGCTPESRNMATNAHTLQWPRAHTLLGNNADDMVLALTNFVFCCSSELVFGMI
jgi:hypothetical protein